MLPLNWSHLLKAVITSLLTFCGFTFPKPKNFLPFLFLSSYVFFLLHCCVFDVSYLPNLNPFIFSIWKLPHIKWFQSVKITLLRPDLSFCPNHNSLFLVININSLLLFKVLSYVCLHKLYHPVSIWVSLLRYKFPLNFLHETSSQKESMQLLLCSKEDSCSVPMRYNVHGKLLVYNGQRGKWSHSF